MSTLRQIEANRRNAQKSTGPTSVTGKAVSSMNALQTGIHAKSLVLSTEKLADLELLIDECYQRHRPASPEARFYVDELIRCEWTLRRLCAAATQMWDYQNHNVYSTCDPEKYPLGKAATANPNIFSRIQYRVMSRCTSLITPTPGRSTSVMPWLKTGAFQCSSRLLISGAFRRVILT